MSDYGHILILDDNQSWRKIIARFLNRKGYSTLEATSLHEAIEATQQHLFHLAICDIRLVDESEVNADGIAFLQWLSSQKLLGGLEVIVLTAHGTREQMRIAFQEHGVYDFIDKSNYNNLELLQVVDRAFAERLHRNPKLKIDYAPNFPLDNFLKLLRQSYLRSHEHLADEWQELFKRLLLNANSVVLSPQSVIKLDPICIRADVKLDNDTNVTRLIQIGPHAMIAQVYQDVSPYFPDLTALQIRRTPLLGAILYSFPELLAHTIHGQERNTLKEQILQLQTKNQRLDEFLTIAAHTLRAPLTTVKSILEDLAASQAESLAAEQKVYLIDAHDEINYEMTLIDRIFNLTRLETGLPLNLQSHDIVNCLEAALVRVSNDLKRKGILLQKDIPNDGIEVECAPEWITIAIHDVLHNAVKFTVEGEVSITCKLEDNHVYILIKDTGIGIHPDEIGKIFDFRSRANAEIEGWGVGLYVTKSILLRHNGSITPESTLGRGTAMHIYLPLRQ